MVTITKSEKEAVLKRFPKAHIKRTMKRQSNRHHYYCEEASYIMEFLNEYRKEHRLIG